MVDRTQVSARSPAVNLNGAIRAARVPKAQHAELKDQTPCVLWFTGLSGAGKSTVAYALEHRLTALGHHTYLLEGDNTRDGLNRDLGFDGTERVEKLRRIGEVARLMVDAGLIVIAVFVSPLRSDRQLVREMFEPHEFIEVFTDTPIEIAEQRDPKGLYRLARDGAIKSFPGIDTPYEPPTDAEIRLQTAEAGVEACVRGIMETLRGNDVIEHVGP